MRNLPLYEIPSWLRMNNVYYITSESAPMSDENNRLVVLHHGNNGIDFIVNPKLEDLFVRTMIAKGWTPLRCNAVKSQDFSDISKPSACC